MIENRGDKFPVAGKFVLDVIGYDVCDQEQMVHCYITLPNAKLTSDVDMTFTTEGTHPFTIKALQDYCDTNKRLFTISVVDVKLRRASALLFYQRSYNEKNMFIMSSTV